MLFLTKWFPFPASLYHQLAKQTPHLSPVRQSPLIVEPVVCNFQLITSLPFPPVGVIHLQVIGAIDRHSYESLIATAGVLHRAGCRHLLLDLRQTSKIELSGVFALLNIARLYANQALLDPELGWGALHAAAAEITPALGKHVKLLAPTPAVRQMLQRASCCQFFEIYAEFDVALVACSNQSESAT